MGKVMNQDQPVIEEELQSRDRTQSTEPPERLSLLQPRHGREIYLKVKAIVKSTFSQKMLSRQLSSQLSDHKLSSSQLLSQLFLQQIYQGNCQVNCVNQNFLQGNCQLNYLLTNYFKNVVHYCDFFYQSWSIMVKFGRLWSIRGNFS